MSERFDLHALDQAHGIVDHLDNFLLVLLRCLLFGVLLADVCSAVTRRWRVTDVRVRRSPTHTLQGQSTDSSHIGAFIARVCVIFLAELLCPLCEEYVVKDALEELLVRV